MKKYTRFPIATLRILCVIHILLLNLNMHTLTCRKKLSFATILTLLRFDNSNNFYEHKPIHQKYLRTYLSTDLQTMDSFHYVLYNTLHP